MSTFAAFMKSLALILHNGKASLGKTSDISRAIGARNHNQIFSIFTLYYTSHSEIPRAYHV